MANYVYQQVICSKEFLEEYFLDEYPIDAKKRMDPPYISFNRIMSVSNLGEYSEKYGEYIYYGYGFSYQELSNGKILVKFATKRAYPIAAIHEAIMIDSTVEWYALEENCIYISRFYWDHGVKQAVVILKDDFSTWVEKHAELDDGLSDEDHIAWYYLQNCKAFWIPFSDDLHLPRFYKEIDKKEKKIIPEENIAYLEAHLGGFEGPNFHVAIDVEQNRICYLEASDSEVEQVALKISPKKMKHFLKEIKKCHVLDWDLQYPKPLGVVDGSSWEVIYVVNGKKIVKSGENHFPDNWKQFCHLIASITGRKFY